MEEYARVLSFAIPGFVLLILIESVIGKLMGVQVNRPMDTISSLSSGMTNTLKSILGLTVVIISYDWMVTNFALFEIKSSILLYVLAFIGLDFVGYWSHRFNHVVNIFWNRHIVHHSSEEFNLACALRQSISAFISIYFFLYVPLALLGVPSKIVAFVAPLHLFAQFWYHTKLVNKMGFLEHILVTPSHHRVHHAINKEYLDKNFSEIFIVWDKWFGTFQAELPDVAPVYGTKSPVKTWNPILINFMHAWQIAKDAWHTQNIKDKLKIWFMPTGWRPADVQSSYPVETVEDVYSRVKYDTESTSGFQGWVWFQLIVNNALLFHLLQAFGKLERAEVWLYGTFLFVSIFAYTALMDKRSYSFIAELLKFSLGVALIAWSGGWFGLETSITTIGFVVGGYLLVSLAATAYFQFFESKAILNYH
jgi:sterol desaturase/sphingolipid hydroxylase (fatty acid hydroxylase superfamily)